jgi:hypothetical protein
MAIGSKGRVTFGSDFLGLVNEATVVTTTGVLLDGGLCLTGSNEGSFVGIYTESGGILQLTTDTGDNDSQIVFSGPFAPTEGGMSMECRFRMPTSMASERGSIFMGFCETLSATTPVLPATRATATTTYTAGGTLGVLLDCESTLIEFFAVAGDNSAAIATVDMKGAVGAANGVQLTGSAGIPGGTIATANIWYIVRVEIDPSGKGRVWFGDYDGGTSLTKPLNLVLQNTTAFTTTDLFYAFCGIQNTAATNEELELDYMFGEAGRNWAAN